jgi:hypothetical protein
MVWTYPVPACNPHQQGLDPAKTLQSLHRSIAPQRQLTFYSKKPTLIINNAGSWQDTVPIYVKHAKSLLLCYANNPCLLLKL